MDSARLIAHNARRTPEPLERRFKTRGVKRRSSFGTRGRPTLFTRSSPMLVILEPNAPESAIDAVRGRAADLGLDSLPFATNGSYTLFISGDNAADAAGELGALPGVLEAVPGEA